MLWGRDKAQTLYKPYNQQDGRKGMSWMVEELRGPIRDGLTSIHFQRKEIDCSRDRAVKKKAVDKKISKTKGIGESGEAVQNTKH